MTRTSTPSSLGLTLGLALCSCAGKMAAEVVAAPGDEGAPPDDALAAPAVAVADAHLAAEAPEPRAPVSVTIDARATAPDVQAAQGRCDRSALLCEDFESGAIDATKWSINAKYGRVEIDSTRAARGTRSLHARLDNAVGTTQNAALIVSKRAFAVAGTQLFIRAYVFIDPASTPDRHFDVVRVWDPQKAFGYTINLEKLLSTAGMPERFRDFWNHLAGEPAVVVTKDRAPLGRWQCWEWEIRGATNELAFSLDGQAVPAMAVSASAGWTAPSTAKVWFGDYAFHTDANHPDGFHLWLDEIAVSTQKIGCAP